VGEVARLQNGIVDLTVTVGAETKSPPSTDMKVELQRHQKGPGFWQVSSVSQSLHTGSHIDSPLHCFPEGGTTAEIPLEKVIGDAVVIDCSYVEPEQPIDVKELERAAPDIQEDLIVIVRTDWTDRAWGDFPAFFTRSPFLTPEGAEWLTARRPRALGFDFFEEYSARLPNFTSEDFVCHRVMLGAGLPLLEQLTNLRAVLPLCALLQDRGNGGRARPLLRRCLTGFRVHHHDAAHAPCRAGGRAGKRGVLAGIQPPRPVVGAEQLEAALDQGPRGGLPPHETGPSGRSSKRWGQGRTRRKSHDHGRHSASAADYHHARKEWQNRRNGLADQKKAKGCIGGGALAPGQGETT
jgi:arylformamidase